MIEDNPARAREWVELGAVVERGLVQYDDRTTFFQWQVDTMLNFIDAVGIDNTIIGSDPGQKNNPFAVNSYERVLDGEPCISSPQRLPHGGGASSRQPCGRWRPWSTL